METEEDTRAKLENHSATKRFRLAIETEEERKARLEKMVVTTQLRLALETEEERRAKKEIHIIITLFVMILFQLQPNFNGKLSINVN